LANCATAKLRTHPDISISGEVQGTAALAAAAPARPPDAPCLSGPTVAAKAEKEKARGRTQIMPADSRQMRRSDGFGQTIHVAKNSVPQAFCKKFSCRKPATHLSSLSWPFLQHLYHPRRC